MIVEMTDLQKLSLDTYKNINVKFNEASGEDALRNIINDACGGKFSFRTFRENKYKVFSIIEEALDITLGVVITNQFDLLAEVRNVPTGDRPSFRVQDNSLFRVARIAGGTNDLRRQKLLDRNFTVDTDYFGVKIYAELELFMANRVNWTDLINRIALSYSNDLGVKIYEAVATSYTSLNATYGVTGTFSDDALFDMVQHIEAKSGKQAVVYGTKKALRKVSKAVGLTDSLKDKINQVGYIDTVSGTDMFLLPQAHKIGTDEFLVDDNMLIVIPQNEKIVKIVVEGESIMTETADAGARTDQQMEYMLQKKMGLSVLQASIYGIYKISA